MKDDSVVKQGLSSKEDVVEKPVKTTTGQRTKKRKETASDERGKFPVC